MTDPVIAEAAAIRLADLSREIEDLENGRLAMLNRLDRMRAELQSSGNRTAAMRASVNLLCEHISNVVSVLAELRAIEEEMHEMGRSLGAVEKNASGLSFEADSLQETLDEAEDELERLSSILIEGKARHPRGH